MNKGTLFRSLRVIPERFFVVRRLRYCAGIDKCAERWGYTRDCMRKSRKRPPLKKQHLSVRKVLACNKTAISTIKPPEGVPTVTGVKWRDNTVLNILKNEKYQGDAWLQKTYKTNHIDKLQRKNRGNVDSYYIKDNHPGIVSRADWEEVQSLMKQRTETYGNARGTGKQNTHYPLTGILFCNKLESSALKVPVPTGFQIAFCTDL